MQIILFKNCKISIEFETKSTNLNTSISHKILILRNPPKEFFAVIFPKKIKKKFMQGLSNFTRCHFIPRNKSRETKVSNNNNNNITISSVSPSHQHHRHRDRKEGEREKEKL